MFRRKLITSTLVLSMVGALPFASAAVVARRITVPAPAAISLGIDDMVCFSVGNCWAAGVEQNSASQAAPFVVQEVAGAWKSAIKLTMPVSTVANMPMTVVDLSCPSTRYCLLTIAASPSLAATFGYRFELKNGTWQAGVKTAIGGPEFQGDYAQSSQPTQGEPHSGCWSDGNCVITSYYRTKFMNWIGFTIAEVNGVWGTAKRLIAPYADSDNNRVTAMDCVTGAGCVATGRYSDELGNSQLFAISTSNGTWSEYTEIANPANTGTDSMVIPNSLSCVDMANCVATGTYGSRTSNLTQFVMVEKTGTWSDAQAVKMPTGYVQKNDPSTYRPPTVDCGDGFTCIATSWGYATTSLAISRPMFVMVTNGTVATAALVQLPTGAVVDARASSDITVAACQSAGHCLTSGTYYDSARVQYSFVQTQSNGSWNRAVKLAQPADTHRVYGYQYMTSAWCFASRSCTLGGSYTDTRENSSTSVVEGVTV